MATQRCEFCEKPAKWLYRAGKDYQRGACEDMGHVAKTRRLVAADLGPDVPFTTEEAEPSGPWWR